uniref:Uncharacterized protein n=1 Tax=Arundo donax TaxID=35708 RepID=A0A0A9GUK4_ARUDO
MWKVPYEGYIYGILWIVKFRERNIFL